MGIGSDAILSGKEFFFNLGKNICKTVALQP